jgi:peptidoglycan LD-endopeptidase CwlK
VSYQLLKADVLFYQRFLKSNGFYTGGLDGQWGPKTSKADTDFLSQSASIAQLFGQYDNRSESNIITLVPKAQEEVRKFLKLMRDNGKNVKILSGTRTYAEQDALYSKGRNGSTESVITNAKGGHSNHNFGIAWDIGLFNADGSYSTNDNDYKAAAQIIMQNMNSLEWGGNWNSFKDYPHYQLKTTTQGVTAIRGLFESGQSYA